jgi:hypothetical protein
MKNIAFVILLLISSALFSQVNVFSDELFSINKSKFSPKRFDLVEKYSLDSVVTVFVNPTNNDTSKTFCDLYEYDSFGRQTMSMNIRTDYDDQYPDTLKKNIYTYFEEPDSMETIMCSYNTLEHDFDSSTILRWSFDNNGFYDKGARFDWYAEENSWRKILDFDFDFDDHGNLLMKRYRSYLDGNEMLYTGFAWMYQFDAFNNIIDDLYLRYNSETLLWDSVSNTQCTFVGVGKLSTRLDRDYNAELGHWQNNYFIQNQYEGDLIIDSIFYHYSEEDLIPYFRNTFDYDEQNNLILKSSFIWDSEASQWKLTSTVDYIYDDLNRMVEQIQSDVDYYLGNSEYDSKTYYSYAGTFSLPDTIVYFDWSVENLEWIADSKNEIEYDTDSRTILNIYYTFDVQNVNWVALNKEEFEYDEAGNELKNCSFHWDLETSEWQSNSCTERLYDQTVTLSDLVLPINDLSNEYFNSMLITESIIEPYVDNKLRTYFYTSSEFEIDVPISNSISFTIFPNPATETIIITGTNLQSPIHISIFDINGKCVFLKYAEPDLPIDITALAKGIYSYRIICGDFCNSGKLVKL